MEEHKQEGQGRSKPAASAKAKYEKDIKVYLLAQSTRSGNRKSPSETPRRKRSVVVRPPSERALVRHFHRRDRS